jgi:hypothetical protein
MKTVLLALLVTGLGNVAIFGGEPPADSHLAIEDSFDRQEPGKGWNSTAGEWKIVDGVLRAREIAAEKHAAATRRIIETTDATYELKFRFVESGKVFHFGFDPARGELKKKGHLFSVIITPESWQILKHVDKDRREEDPNEILAEQKTAFRRGSWYTLRVTTAGTHVSALIDQKEPLKASHPTFAVKKPTLVFRCLGDGVEIDDLRVWTQRKKS